MQRYSLKEILALSPVIPVVTIDRKEDVAPLAQALLAGGIRVIEITLRTEAGLPAIRMLREAFPDMVIGAGTVTTPELFLAAVEAGVDFIVSPGSSTSLFLLAEENNIPFLPGVMTPTEIMQAREAGFRYVKFFPAVPAGGLAMLKSFEAVFPDIRFCPTGGIDTSNYRDFLALSSVPCVGGSWLVAKSLIAAQEWKKVTALAKEITGACP